MRGRAKGDVRYRLRPGHVWSPMTDSEAVELVRRWEQSVRFGLVVGRGRPRRVPKGVQTQAREHADALLACLAELPQQGLAEAYWVFTGEELPAPGPGLWEKRRSKARKRPHTARRVAVELPWPVAHVLLAEEGMRQVRHLWAKGNPGEDDWRRLWALFAALADLRVFEAWGYHLMRCWYKHHWFVDRSRRKVDCPAHAHAGKKAWQRARAKSKRR